MTLSGDEEIKLSIIDSLLDKAKEESTKQKEELDQSGEEYTDVINEITKRMYFFSKHIDSNEPSAPKSLASFLSLLQLIQFSSFRSSDSTYFVRVRNPMLRPLMHHLFVKEMCDVQRHIRRGYVPRTETLGVIRGRIHSSSAARCDDSGETTLLCHYDEFEEGTHLLRVLVTALDVVASGNWLSRSHRGQKDLEGLASADSRAIELRRFLHTFPNAGDQRHYIHHHLT